MLGRVVIEEERVDEREKGFRRLTLSPSAISTTKLVNANSSLALNALYSFR